MDIGQPKRIIEIVPASLPIPGGVEPPPPNREPAEHPAGPGTEPAPEQQPAG
jgi:hypothetical protein